jgi:hypothetical protein
MKRAAPILFFVTAALSVVNAAVGVRRGDILRMLVSIAWVVIGARMGIAMLRRQRRGEDIGGEAQHVIKLDIDKS